MKILSIILLCMIPGLIAYPITLWNNEDIHSGSDYNKWPGRLKYILRALLFSVVWLLLGILILIAGVAERYEKRRKAFRNLKGFVNGKDEEGYVHHDGKLRFRQMGGAGNLYCQKCGYEEHIISFLHSFPTGPGTWHESGYQCQVCGKITSIEKNLWMKELPKCECGGELSRDEGLFCPVCRSYKVKYKLKIIT